MDVNDENLEAMFGSPAVAAADLHELRIWTHKRTSLQPNTASSAGRELCMSIDPTWPLRAMTNERLSTTSATRPRGYGAKAKVAESTIEAMMSVADGREARTTVTRSSRLFETLWPCQAGGWNTWVNQVCDLTGKSVPEIRTHRNGLDTVELVHPAQFMLLVRAGGTPYLDAVADAMDMEHSLLKFASICYPPAMFFDGLPEFQRAWLDRFPDGELALWLRSTVCCGLFTSHQLAWVMGLETARSTTNSWID